MKPLARATTLILLATTACAPDESAEGTSPELAPRAAVDRFSDEAATMFRRTAMPELPGPDEPIDFDEGWLVGGLGPSGQPISYYALDVQLGRTMLVHRIVDGDGVPIAGQLPIVEALPGEPGYSDFWQFVDHEAEESYVPNAIVDADTLRAQDWPQTLQFEGLNRPLVPHGSTAARRVSDDGDGAREWAWIDGEVVEYLSFAEAPIPVLGEFVPYSLIFVCFDVPPTPEGEPQSGFCAQPDGRTHNVLETIPGDALYSPLWDVRVYDPTQFDTVLDLPAAREAAPVANLATVNCPVAAN